MRERHGNIHLDTGAFALDALPERERIVFEEHLRDCKSCAVEVRELAATAARLGGATAGVRPPDELRERVMRGIRSTRQEGPAPVRSLWADRLRRRLPPVALAACVAAAATFGGVALWQHDQAQQARAQARDAEQQSRGQAARQAAITAVLTAPDARTATARFGNGATGTVVASPGHNQAVFLVGGMPPPPTGSVYQLWYDRAGHLAPAGFMDSSQPSSAVLLAGAVGGATAVGVTVEPDGGSARPTSAPVVLIALPA
ncbi:anti-sigma factor [Streptomycetaceae bacterium NBC_01309]